MQPTLSAELLFAFYFRRQGRNERASNNFFFVAKLTKKREKRYVRFEKTNLHIRPELKER